ncbi:MAG: allophycocyanin subunit beta [Synechococcales cyanobacterium C42_A2020_086]|jgi:phycobilisome core component|nr:allophycocyanin subunit beta [Synechococcales cyanobacterium C42_A2020_086]
MQDKVTGVVEQFNLTGESLDRDTVESLKGFLDTGSNRVLAASIIGSNAAEIVKTAASQLFQEQPELVRPGGNAYTTRRYTMYLRDMNYFLRYCSYALVAGDVSILDERLLAGLRETFNSLGIPLGPTARSIQLMKDLVKQKLIAAGVTNIAFVDEPFDYVVRSISETDI